jgi:hypothetical protein
LSLGKGSMAVVGFPNVGDRGWRVGRELERREGMAMSGHGESLEAKKK